MGAMAINRAEKKMLVHLIQGGQPDDEGGQEYANHFAQVVSKDKTTAPILRKHGMTLGQVAEFYRRVLSNLMPEPWMNVSGPILVPTQWFMEPHRLDGLLEYRAATDEGDLDSLVNAATQLATETRKAHDEQYGRPSVERFRNLPVGGGGGCSSILLIPVLLGAATLALI